MNVESDFLQRPHKSFNIQSIYLYSFLILYITFYTKLIPLLQNISSKQFFVLKHDCRKNKFFFFQIFKGFKIKIDLNTFIYR